MILIEVSVGYAIVAMILAYLFGRFHEFAHDFPPALAAFWPVTLPIFLIANTLFFLGDLGERDSNK